jgi:hypothetical protein
MEAKSELLKLLSEDRLDDFFAQADAESGHDDQYILLKSKWHSLQKQLHASTMSQDDYEVGVAQVRQGLLNWVRGATHGPSAHGELKPFFRFRLAWLAFGLAIGLALFWQLSRKPKIEPASEQEKPSVTQPSTQGQSRPPNIKVEGIKPAALSKVKLKLATNRIAKFYTTSRKISYEVLDAELEPTGDKRSLLHIQVLFKNADRFPVNFWNSSFRLEAGGEKRRLAPVGDLNEVVPAQSDKEGIVTFAVPADARSFQLFIQDYDKEKGILIEI